MTLEIYMCTCVGIPRFRAYGAVILVVAAYCWGRKPRMTHIELAAKLRENELLFAMVIRLVILL
jgi:hypothetical protein